MKWFALIAIAIGIALIVGACRMDSRFEDGTFLLQIITVIAGTVCVLGGLIWLLALVFMSV